MKTFAKINPPARKAALGILQGVSPKQTTSLPQRLQLALKSK